MICLAIIVDFDTSVLGKVGKKKNIECGLSMVQIDEHTWLCPMGHKRRTAAYDKKGISQFYRRQEDEGE